MMGRKILDAVIPAQADPKGRAVGVEIYKG